MIALPGMAKLPHSRKVTFAGDYKYNRIAEVFPKLSKHVCVCVSCLFYSVAPILSARVSPVIAHLTPHTSPVHAWLWAGLFLAWCHAHI